MRELQPRGARSEFLAAALQAYTGPMMPADVARAAEERARRARLRDQIHRNAEADRRSAEARRRAAENKAQAQGALHLAAASAFVVGVRQALRRIEKPPCLSLVAAIMRAAAEEFGVTVTDMRSMRRPANVVLARQVAAYLARELTTHSMPDLGRRLGRDHSTIHHSVHKIGALVRVDPELAARIERIKRRVDR